MDFVRLKSELCGYGLAKGSKYGFEGAEEIIRERIEAGWEYCGYVPLYICGVGGIETISLVFQREE